MIRLPGYSGSTRRHDSGYLFLTALVSVMPTRQDLSLKFQACQKMHVDIGCQAPPADLASAIANLLVYLGLSFNNVAGCEKA